MSHAYNVLLLDFRKDRRGVMALARLTRSAGFQKHAHLKERRSAERSAVCHQDNEFET